MKTTIIRRITATTTIIIRITTIYIIRIINNSIKIYSYNDIMMTT